VVVLDHSYRRATARGVVRATLIEYPGVE
jgi:hypothetical protein